MMVFLFNKERKLVMLFFRFSFHYIPFLQAFRLLLTHLGTSFATRSSREYTSRRREKTEKMIIFRGNVVEKKALKMHQHKYKRIISHFQLFIFDPRHLYFKPRKCVRPVYRRNSITCINEIFNVVTEHHQSTSKKENKIH